MPARSKVTQLPDPLKAELDRRLIRGGFSDYTALAGWLAEQGFEISRSAVHRYGQEFEANLAAIKIATEQARAVAEAAGDDEGAMNEALIRLVQQKAFDALVRLDADGAILPRMGVMIAKLSKASVDQNKWKAEARRKAAQAVENIEEKLKSAKLDPEALRVVREEIYGIF
jgi:hypothetical protein